MPKTTENLALLPAVGLLLANRALLRLGLRRRPDGWRRAAGLVLRGENATFILSAFGVRTPDTAPNDPPSAHAGLATRINQFLSHEPDLHACVRRDGPVHRVESCAGPCYTLGFSDRPVGPARFVPPADWTGDLAPVSLPADAAPACNTIARLGPDATADLWFRFNHVAIDGVPAQETLSRLESEWGTDGDVVYPHASAFAPHAPIIPVGGREESALAQAFVDFSALLAWRKQVNTRLAQPMTVSAAMLWQLGTHPAFDRVRFGTTVELPADGPIGRGVGVVVVRPADYASAPDPLQAFVSNFNRQMEQTRKRATSGALTLDAAALVPPRLARRLLHKALAGDDAFGSAGLSLLRDARVFGAPLPDTGHPHGFFAVGSLNLDAGGGRKVGCVTVKGEGGRLRTRLDAFAQAMTCTTVASPS